MPTDQDTNKKPAPKIFTTPLTRYMALPKSRRNKRRCEKCGLRIRGAGHERGEDHHRVRSLTADELRKKKALR